jgi:ligand-binding SRPBCC domain-containing protein
MIAFETSVRIERPTEAVFDYVSDPSTFPRWNSAVQAVRSLSGDDGVERSRYVMERDLPGGRAVNELEVVTRDRPTEFAVRTISGPTPFVYRYRFVSENGETVVRLDGEVDVDGVASLLAPVAGRAIKSGVDANFRVLKEVLESRRSR